MKPFPHILIAALFISFSCFSTSKKEAVEEEIQFVESNLRGKVMLIG